MNQCFSNFFKNENIKNRSFYLHPIAMMILADAIRWCTEKGLHCEVTDTVTCIQEDSALNRVSSTHREGRAFDMSTAGWPKDSVDFFIHNFSNKYIEFAAISPTTGKPELVVYHNNGNGFHLHIQINKRYALLDIKLPELD